MNMMAPYFSIPGIDIYHGSALAVLRSLPAGSVQTCVTSPPYYGLRSYGTAPQVWGGDVACGHEWAEQGRTLEQGNKRNPVDYDRPRDRSEDKGVPVKVEIRTATCGKCGAWLGELGSEPTPDLYFAHMADVFREVRRVMKPDGCLWLNLADSYAVRHSSRRDTGRQGYGSPDRDRPARPGSHWQEQGLKEKDLIGSPWAVAFSLRADGWYLRSDVIWHKPNPMPSSAGDRPTTAHEYLFLLSKSQRYYYDADAIAEPATSDQSGGPALNGKAHSGACRTLNGSPRHRLTLQGEQEVFRRPNAPKPTELAAYLNEAAEACGHTTVTVADALGFPFERVRHYFRTDESGSRLPDPKTWDRLRRLLNLDGRYDAAMAVEAGTNEVRADGKRNKRSVWTVPVNAYPDAHFATYPPALIEPCIKAGSRPGDVVLDPFHGSGTTGAVAQKWGRRYVGIELSAAYIDLSKERFRQAVLFPATADGAA